MEDKLLHLYGLLKKEAARSELFALRARHDKRYDLAQLFAAVALSQTRQANRVFMQIRGSISDSEVNRSEMLDQVLPDSISRYESLQQEAEAKENRAIAVGMGHSRSVQLKNRSLFKRLESKGGAASYYICNFCGFVATDKAPEECPICTAPARRFDRVGE